MIWCHSSHICWVTKGTNHDFETSIILEKVMVRQDDLCKCLIDMGMNCVLKSGVFPTYGWVYLEMCTNVCLDARLWINRLAVLEDGLSRQHLQHFTCHRKGEAGVCLKYLYRETPGLRLNIGLKLHFSLWFNVTLHTYVESQKERTMTFCTVSL